MQKFYHAAKSDAGTHLQQKRRDCARSRIQRGRVRRDRRHVADSQVLDDSLHRLNCCASARTALNVIELSYHIAWRNGLQVQVRKNAAHCLPALAEEAQAVGAKWRT